MNSRKAVRRFEPQPRCMECVDANEFKIEYSVINNVEVTSVDKRKVIGKPVVYASINCGRIVGTTNIFYQNDLIPYELSSGEDEGDIEFLKYRSQNLNRKTNSVLIDQHCETKFTKEKIPNPINNNLNSTAKLLAKRIEAKIERQFGVDTKLGELLRLTFPELFDIMVKEAERLNTELSPGSFSSEDLFKGQIFFKGACDSVSSMFLHSMIYRKNLWWVNLKSREVTASRRGIYFEGKQYLPVEDRDVFLLRKLIEGKIHATVTIYPHPKDPRILFWIHNKRMIQIHLQMQNKEFDSTENIEITKP
jgi:hypothetical protein